MVSVLADLTHAVRGAEAGRKIAEQSMTLNWDYLIRKMSDEGVLFLFFYHIHRLRLRDLLPAGVYGILSRRYYANLRRNMIACTVLKPVFETLNEHRIPFIVLKGIALAEMVYPGLGMRGMSDTDILVKKGDMFGVEACLSALGYSPRDSSVACAIENPEGYLASLDYRKNDGSLPNIHVHWHPVNTSVPAYMFAGRIDPDRLWEMALPATVASAEVRALCPEHQVIYLCEHALRINHSFDRLILMYDLFYVIETYRDEIDWDFIVEEARRFNVSKFVFLSLAIVQHYTSRIVFEEVMSKLRPENLTFGERLFLNIQLSNHRFRGGSIFVYLAMNNGLAEKCRFLFRTFFPPPQILMQRRYAKHIEFGASFYTHRVWEVLSHPFRIYRRKR
ncbi:MAG: nucleotidyltransferase domain-containing protein [Syntrophales bacterium]